VKFWSSNWLPIAKKGNIDTLWLFNIAMENGPFIDDFPTKTSIYKGFSMAMLNNQRVPIVPNQSLLNKLLPVRVMSTSLPETIDHS